MSTSMSLIDVLLKIVLPVVGGVVVIGAIVFLIVYLSKKKRIKQSEIEADKKVEEVANSLTHCFGGEENIQSISQQGSRVSILVKDMNKINKEEISSKLSSVMYMGNKIVCVIGSRSEEFSELLKANIKQNSSK